MPEIYDANFLQILPGDPAKTIPKYSNRFTAIEGEVIGFEGDRVKVCTPQGVIFSVLPEDMEVAA